MPRNHEPHTFWLMRSFPSDADMNWGQYAVVKFEDRWLRKLWKLERAYKAAAKGLETLHEIVVWDSAVLFFDHIKDVVNDQQDRLENYDYIEITAEQYEALGDDATRTECDMIHVHRDAVYWRSSVKHSDITVETPRIMLTDFQCEVHGRDPRKKRTCLKCLTR